MKNPELPCWSYWDGPCVDGDRCPVHANCICGDAGFFYQPPDEAIGDPNWDGWDSCKVPCKCVTETPVPQSGEGE